MKPHFAIVGGGIIGTAIARELAMRQMGKVTVLDAESKLGMHASGRNSGVVHSGFNAAPGTLKATMCVQGNAAIRQYCAEYGVPLEATGTVVIARDDEEENRLENLLARGIKNGVPDVRMIDRAELREREPYAEGTKALFSPTGAIVDSVALLTSLAEQARRHGVEYRFNTRVRAIDDKEIITDDKTLKADHVVNCAGLHADVLAHSCGVAPELRIIPFRGEYHEVSGVPLKSMLYAAEDPQFPFLGVHLTRTIDGKVLAGPTATLSFGRESYQKEIKAKESLQMLCSRQFWRLLTHRDFRKMARYNIALSLSKQKFADGVAELIIDTVEKDQLKPYRAGIRAQVVDRQGNLINDFKVMRGRYSTHVVNAVSPGMTASMPFATYIVDNFLKDVSA